MRSININCASSSKSLIVTAALLIALPALLVAPLPILTCSVAAQDEDYIPGESVAAEHAKDKRKLLQTKDELKDIRSQMESAASTAEKLRSQVAVQQQVKQFELTARECSYEFAPNTFIQCLGYNGTVPGPTIHVQEGDPVRIVVRNRMTVPTSLYFQGFPLPHNVDGLPRSGAGLIAPGGSYTYQFMAPHAGTYWYHPQVIHGDQQDRGLFGALIVDSREPAQAPNQDQVLVVSSWCAYTPPPSGTGDASQATGSSSSGSSRASSASGLSRAASPTSPFHRNLPQSQLHLRALSQKDAPFPAGTRSFLTLNGKCAPLIPVLDLTPGTRCRLRVINTTGNTIPLTITGHQLQSLHDLATPPSPPTDVVVVQPGTVDNLEFTCDNPGIWSFCSMLPHQNETLGNFPGGIARAVRYSGFSP